MELFRTPPLKTEQLFGPLDRSHQAMASKLTVAKITINSDTDIFSLDLSRQTNVAEI